MQGLLLYKKIISVFLITYMTSIICRNRIKIVFYSVVKKTWYDNTQEPATQNTQPYIIPHQLTTDSTAQSVGQNTTDEIYTVLLKPSAEGVVHRIAHYKTNAPLSLSLWRSLLAFVSVACGSGYAASYCGEHCGDMSSIQKDVWNGTICSTKEV